MIRRSPVLVGAMLGAIAGALWVGAHARAAAARPAMLADCGGRIKTVVMHYARGADFVLPVYRAFLAQHSAALQVYMVCPDRAALDELREKLGPVPPRLVPVFVDHPITPWSRDRWVTLLPTGDSPRTLLSPLGEKDAAIWPERAGDSRVGADLAAAVGVWRAQRSGLYFDGGDFLADGKYLFATRALSERNIQHTLTDHDQLLRALRQTFAQEPILLDEGPDHHAGMFMMAAGDHRMLVADPSLARPLFDPAGSEAAALEGGPDFSSTTQERFDSVARAVVACGYSVTRIPVVTPVVGKNYLTFVNTIIDAAPAGPTVYMPAFPGQPRLTAAATAVWSSLGYRVCPIDCSSVWTKGGTVHCLVNVVERE